MLASFSVENWRVFKERATFSCTASRERGHGETLAVLPPMYAAKKLLPAAAVFGANGAGKSSLIEALCFVRGLVVQGRAVGQPMMRKPFLLDAGTVERPTSFEVEILVGRLLYVYSLSCTDREIVREKLVAKRTRSEQLMFERVGKEICLGKKFDDERHRVVAENTRGNQTFLHNSASQNLLSFRQVYDWFNISLNVLGVDARYDTYSHMFLRKDFLEFVNEGLRAYAPGVSGLDLVPVSRESLPAPADIVESTLANARAQGKSALQVRNNRADGSEIYIIFIKETGDECFKVKVNHKGAGGEVAFDLVDESRGTQRLIEMLPVFFELAAEWTNGPAERVYVLDEFGRDFHSAMTTALLKSYLGKCGPATRCQFLFTTHDLMLMDAGLLRRDEIWTCEKGKDGASALQRLGAARQVRADKDLLKGYVAGELGGCPKFSS